jgi:hypothetical protein
MIKIKELATSIIFGATILSFNATANATAPNIFEAEKNADNTRENSNSLNVRLIFSIVGQNLSNGATFCKDIHPLCKESSKMVLSNGYVFGLCLKFSGKKGRHYLAENDLLEYLNADTITFDYLDENYDKEMMQRLDIPLNRDEVLFKNMSLFIKQPLMILSDHPYLNVRITGIQNDSVDLSDINQIQNIKSFHVSAYPARGENLHFGRFIDSVSINTEEFYSGYFSVKLGEDTKRFSLSSYNCLREAVIDLSEARLLEDIHVDVDVDVLPSIRCIIPAEPNSIKNFHMKSLMTKAEILNLLDLCKLKNSTFSIELTDIINEGGLEYFVKQLSDNNSENSKLIITSPFDSDEFLFHNQYEFDSFEDLLNDYPNVPHTVVNNLDSNGGFFNLLIDTDENDVFKIRNINLIDSLNTIVGFCPIENTYYIFELQHEAFEALRSFSGIVDKHKNIDAFLKIWF